MHTVTDLRPEHSRAIAATVRVVEQVRRDHLDRPTPCAEWNLERLLAHMTAQHRGFAAAARGCGDNLEFWRVDEPVDDSVGVYVAAADEVVEAFADDGVLERDFALPELSTALTFPGARAIGFHLVDFVVHGWDVARTIGVDYQLDAELASVALRIALEVPDDRSRQGPTALFRPALPSRRDDVLDRILAHLGRSPDWMPLAC